MSTNKADSYQTFFLYQTIPFFKAVPLYFLDQFSIEFFYEEFETKKNSI